MRLLIVLTLALGAVVGLSYILGRDDSAAGTRVTVRVERADLVRHAVAVGRIEARREFPVKSLTGGILTRLFVKLGDRVAAGAPLAEVRPVITNLDHIRAERAVVAAREGEENAREFLEGKHLVAWMVRWMQGGKNLERMNESAQRARRQAEERLRLLREGKITVEERDVDYVVRAPSAGQVVEVRTREGEPVVASSNFGSGTVLVVVADLDHPVFRGTVDEIDVGRLQVGMAAGIEIGALPQHPMTGRVTEIGLRARRQNNAVVFDVTLDLDRPTAKDVVLRSGYSAVAKVEVAARRGVLVLPERVVGFGADGASVRVADGSPAGRRTPIETGLSDGLRIEVKGGLDEGTEILER